MRGAAFRRMLEKGVPHPGPGAVREHVQHPGIGRPLKQAVR